MNRRFRLRSCWDWNVVRVLWCWPSTWQGILWDLTSGVNVASHACHRFTKAWVLRRISATANLGNWNKAVDLRYCRDSDSCRLVLGREMAQIYNRYVLCFEILMEARYWYIIWTSKGAWRAFGQITLWNWVRLSSVRTKWNVDITDWATSRFWLVHTEGGMRVGRMACIHHNKHLFMLVGWDNIITHCRDDQFLSSRRKYIFILTDQ